MQIDKIVVLGMHPYPWHFQNISDTMRSMTQSFAGFRRIFINPSVGFRKAWQEGYGFRASWECKEDQGVLVCTPPLEIVPSSFGLGNLKNIWVTTSLTRMAEKKLGTNWREETVVYLSSGGIAQSYHTMQALNPKWLIFDILDDNLGFPGIPASEKRVLENQFQQLLQNSTLVTAVSEHLVKKLQADFSVSAKWLPNGVDVERFRFRPEYGQPVPELKGLKKPLIGFVGAFTSWIDFELLLKVADHPTTGTLVLIGPVMEGAAPADLLNRLRTHPKVKWLGVKPYEQVPHLLHQFDTLILPRNYEPHSMASDPLKLYEYMATGKPVVATAIPSALRFRDVIYVGQSHREFLAALEQAGTEWSDLRAQREMHAVQSLSWKNRAAKLISLLEEKL